MVQYQYGHIPLLVLEFITGTGMLLCPYRYWHCCTLVQYQYGHSPLSILAFNCASTGIDISAFWFSTSIVTVHYQHWHLLIVPVLVLAFLHLGSVPVLAHTITGTGIQKRCSYRYWHCCTLVNYGMGIVRYWCWHSILPVPVLAFQHLGSVPVQAQSITRIGIQNGARTGTGISALWFSTSMGTFHYRNWDSTMVPVPVLELDAAAPNSLKLNVP